MTRRLFRGLVGMGILVLGASVAVDAHHLLRRQWKGVINDYTPQNETDPSVSVDLKGPWQIAGEWSLLVEGDPGRAEFSAALGMVRSDEGALDNGGLDPQSARGAHTHHISVSGVTVTAIPNGIEVSGPATITGNGNFPPPFGSSSSVVVDITGGNAVPYSNITLRFGGDAIKHFGTMPVHGVVRSYREDHTR
jgi:hypothetical protein